jgi:hypothetical protein
MFLSLRRAVRSPFRPMSTESILGVHDEANPLLAMSSSHAHFPLCGDFANNPMARIRSD